MGRIASYYYLNHVTVRMFKDDLGPLSDLEHLIGVLSVSARFRNCHLSSETVISVQKL